VHQNEGACEAPRARTHTLTCAAQKARFYSAVNNIKPVSVDIAVTTLQNGLDETDEPVRIFCDAAITLLPFLTGWAALLLFVVAQESAGQVLHDRAK